MPKRKSFISNNSKTMEFQQKSAREHVLLRPETYGGPTSEDEWIIMENGKAEKKVVQPMLFKVFDEAIVNVADAHQRKSGVNTVDICIGPDWFSIENNGKTVPVRYHKEKDIETGKKIYLPEMLWFRMRSGRNFNDSEERYGGGRNGIGIKLPAIFSTKAEITISDGKKIFNQIYLNNMKDAQPPTITASTGEKFTRIFYKLDMERFTLRGTPLTDFSLDICKLFKNRVYDLAMCCKGVSVQVNNMDVPNLSFEEYTKAKMGGDSILTCSKKNWEVCVVLTDRDADEDVDISFCNNVWTKNGGTHVEHIVNLVCSAMSESAAVKKMKLRKSDIKKQIRVAVKCYLPNPTFDSQMKYSLTTSIKEIEKLFQFTGKEKKQLQRGPLMERLEQIKEEKDGRKLSKNDGKKTKNLNILKLSDAKKAGTKDSAKCTLILTEGDSALALALAGLSVVGKNHWGAFPIKGKMLNCIRATTSQFSSNVIVQNIMKILGLKHGKVYTDVKDLRYGKIMIMADQDVDGSHIRGLIMALIGSKWKSLLEIPGFVTVMKTPLAKFFVRKKCVHVSFTQSDLENYQSNMDSNVRVKYYKGLGTSTLAEAKEYFSNIDRYRFNVTGNTDLFFKAYNEDSALRKHLSRVEPEVYDGKTYDEFVKGPYSEFVVYDNKRKIASGIDGLKVVQRKILWVFLTKKYKQQQKVGQMQGIISSLTLYHHGENNIAIAMINMAQSYVGAYNLPWLKDHGQFGTRAAGGSDAAAARYIYTELNDWVKLCYREEDLPVLESSVVDGTEVEVKEFAPIIPMIMVNGQYGLGTGWSSMMIQHDPLDVIDAAKKYVNQMNFILSPHNRGHNGTYYRTVDNKWHNRGEWSYANKTLKITELPIGVWTNKIESILKDPKCKLNFKSFDEDHVDDSVCFVIKGVEEKDVPLFEKTLKLDISVTERNVCFFGTELLEVEQADIFKHWWIHRRNTYTRRKEHQLACLQEEYDEIQSKVRFLNAVLGNRLNLQNSPEDLVRMCNDIPVDPKYLDLSIRQLTPAKMKQSMDRMADNREEYNKLYKMREYEMWIKELNELEKHLRGNTRQRLKRNFVDLT